MAAFGQMTLTAAGAALLALAQTGTTMNFTRVAIGDGALPGGTDLEDLTALVNELHSLAITSMTTDGDQAIIRAAHSTAGGSAETLREIGLFADDPANPGVDEILYCVANAGATADHLPADGGGTVLEIPISITAVITNALNVEATINSSLAYVTHSELQALFPPGIVIMWSGAANAIPTGWALCDGTNGTADMRDKFIIGAGSTYAVGATGGASSVTLTTNNLPDIEGGGYVGVLGATAGGLEDGQDQPNRTVVEGGGQAFSILPPYYALCFIKKLAY